VSGAAVLFKRSAEHAACRDPGRQFTQARKEETIASIQLIDLPRFALCDSGRCCTLDERLADCREHDTVGRLRSAGG